MHDKCVCLCMPVSVSAWPCKRKRIRRYLRPSQSQTCHAFPFIQSHHFPVPLPSLCCYGDSRSLSGALLLRSKATSLPLSPFLLLLRFFSTATLLSFFPQCLLSPSFSFFLSSIKHLCLFLKGTAGRGLCAGIENRWESE